MSAYIMFTQIVSRILIPGAHVWTSDVVLPLLDDLHANQQISDRWATAALLHPRLRKFKGLCLGSGSLTWSLYPVEAKARRLIRSAAAPAWDSQHCHA
jgi:hypothetical protein